MPTQNVESRLMLFPTRNRGELSEHMRREYGEPVSKILERTKTKRLSVADQKDTLSQLKNAGLNENAHALLDAYRLHLAELRKKEIVQDRWYNTVGRGTKSAALAPFRAIGWSFKNHPVLTTAGLTGLAAYLAYAFGIPLAQFAGEGGDERVRGIADTMRNLTRFRPYEDTPGRGEIPIPLPQYPEIRPPRVQVPDW